MQLLRSTHRSLICRVSCANVAALCFMLLFAQPGRAQRGVSGSQQHPVYSPSQGQSSSGIQGDAQGNSVDEEKRLKALNADRQKRMVSDTNKLLRLVRELNSEIAHSNPESLTPEQLRKLTDIEKLAHGVKEKMGMSVRGLPPFQPPMHPMQ
jgi:hypothetical protein